MKLSPRTIQQLARIIIGDTKVAPYRSGPDLVRLFNEFGANDLYGKDFPARWRYADEKITKLSETPDFGRFITHVFDPREFLGTAFDAQAAIKQANEYLKFDSLKIVNDGDFYRLRDLAGATVEFASPYVGSKKLTHVFTDEQIAKCDEKLARDDYDGAITNARSLVQAVLVDLEKRFDSTPPPYDGDLSKLYRRIKNHLHLDPAQVGVAEVLRQILSGLTSIVSGVAAMRNKMSDAHARTFRPQKHHAKLAVNAAKTLADFLFETAEYQRVKSTKGDGT